VIGARRVEQQRLRQRRMRGRGGIEQQGPHALGERRAAGSRVRTASMPRAFSRSASSAPAWTCRSPRRPRT
jgi:hypothetical protein